MTKTKFSWSRMTDSAGVFYSLVVTGEGAHRVIGGHCYRRCSTKRWVALVSFFDGGNVQVECGAPQAAIRAANAEVDRRSIGLLGVDDITFAMGAK